MIRLLRKAWTANTVTVTILAAFLALLIGAVLVVLGNQQLLDEYGYFFAEPGTVLADTWTAVADAYTAIFEGSIVNPATVADAFSGSASWADVFGPISSTVTYAVPLVFSGLAVALAFRSGLFNIGGQGQVIMGCIGAALVGFLIPLPLGLHLIAVILGAALAGAVWAAIAGVLKARTGAHEVIVTIMLNAIAFLFLTWLINQPGVHDPSRPDAISRKIDESARMPLLSSGQLRFDLGLPLALAAAAGVGWLIDRSTTGFEMRAVGANPDAARTAGISVGRAYLLAMVIAGALAGIGGGMLVYGTSGLGNSFALTGGVAGQIGFDGITVALLGRGRPWGVVASAALFGALHAGGNTMQQTAHVAIDLVLVIQALIVIFIAAPALVRQIFRLRASGSGGVATGLAKGW